MVEPEVKEKIIRLITALFPDTKIYLFGSRVGDKHGKYADIDIALDAGRKLTNTEINETKSILSGSDIKYKIDIVDFNKVDDDIKDEIIKERIIWKN